MFKTTVLALALVSGVSSHAVAGPTIKVQPRADIKHIDLSGAIKPSGELPIIKIPMKPTAPDDIGVAHSGKGGPLSSGSSLPDVMTMLECVVEGASFGDAGNIKVANLGAATIPAGTRVRWQIASTRLLGAAVFATPLLPGKAAVMRGVLHDNVPASAACVAVITK